MHVEREFEPPPGRNTFFVYEWPVRVWHWFNALAIVVLAATGYYISNPFWPNPPGDASLHFVLGYVRFTHFAAAQFFAIGLLGRLYWAFAGNRYAHQMFFLPLTDRTWWRGVWLQFRWYLFLEREPLRYLGHNPLAQLEMVILFTIPAFFMAFSGFALYSEGEGVDSWHDRLFGWVIPPLGGSQEVHSLHHLGMWVLGCFALLHVYIAIREEILSRQTILPAMITGRRTFRE